MEEQFIESQNAWKPWLLHSGFEWKETSKMTPIDMDFINLFKMACLITCAVLKVPPPCIGVSEDATLANLTEYKKEFWHGGVIPNVSLVLTAYNRSWIRPRWGREFRLWYDLSKVEALKENRSEKLEDAVKMHKDLNIPLGAVNTILNMGWPENIEEIVDEYKQKKIEENQQNLQFQADLQKQTLGSGNNNDPQNSYRQKELQNGKPNQNGRSLPGKPNSKSYENLTKIKEQMKSFSKIAAGRN